MMKEKPKFLVVGLGETGCELASKLTANWHVMGLDVRNSALDEARQTSPEGPDFTLVQGDGTSGFVLKKADVGQVHGAVTCTGSDEVNLEVLRVLKETFAIHNRFALMYSLDWEEKYRAEGVELVSQDHACAAILETRIEGGRRIATSIGMGEGEIMQVEVLPNSSVIGKPLTVLGGKRWLVGAIYRNRELIVPHGETELAAGDRVLIIGEPEILPSIATLIRAGDSEFPLQYGSHVVTLCDTDVKDVVEEATYLIKNTRADLFAVLGTSSVGEQSVGECCRSAEVPYDVCCGKVRNLEGLVPQLLMRDVGILIMPPTPLSFLARVGMARSRLARLSESVTSPVLVSRSSFPYKKILLAMAEVPFHTSAAQLAIDLARMVGAELHLGVVRQPEIVVGTETHRQMDERRKEVERLAGMYHVKLNVVSLEGNPIAELQHASRDYDLLVLPRPRNRKASVVRPDIGLNLMHRAYCSVMVMPC